MPGPYLRGVPSSYSGNKYSTPGSKLKKYYEEQGISVPEEEPKKIIVKEEDIPAKQKEIARGKVGPITRVITDPITKEVTYYGPKGSYTFPEKGFTFTGQDKPGGLRSDEAPFESESRHPQAEALAEEFGQDVQTSLSLRQQQRQIQDERPAESSSRIGALFGLYDEEQVGKLEEPTAFMQLASLRQGELASYNPLEQYTAHFPQTYIKTGDELVKLGTQIPDLISGRIPNNILNVSMLGDKIDTTKLSNSDMGSNLNDNFYQKTFGTAEKEYIQRRIASVEGADYTNTLNKTKEYFRELIGPVVGIGKMAEYDLQSLPIPLFKYTVDYIQQDKLPRFSDYAKGDILQLLVEDKDVQAAAQAAILIPSFSALSTLAPITSSVLGLGVSSYMVGKAIIEPSTSNLVGATYGTVGLIGEGYALYKGVTSRILPPEIESVINENIATRVWEGGERSILSSSYKVRVGSKTFDVIGKGTEVGINIAEGQQLTFGGYKFYTDTFSSAQTTRGLRTLVGEDIYSTNLFKMYSPIGNKVSFKYGKISTKSIPIIKQGINDIIATDYASISYSTLAGKKLLSKSKFPIKVDFSKALGKGKPFSAAQGIIKETFKTEDVTISKGLFKEQRGKSLTNVIKEVNKLKVGKLKELPESPYTGQNIARWFESVDNLIRVNTKQELSAGGGNLVISARNTALNVARQRAIAESNSLLGKSSFANIRLGISKKQERTINAIKIKQVASVKNKQITSSYLSQKNLIRQISIPKSKQTTKLLTRTLSKQSIKQISTPSSKTLTKLNVGLKQLQDTSSLLKQITRLSNININTFVGKTTIPNIPEPERPIQMTFLRLPSTPSKKKKKKEFTLPTGKYSPSLRAIAFNIRGKVPKVLTGLETRPIKI